LYSYFGTFSSVFLTIFLSPEISTYTRITIHVPFPLSRIMMCGLSLSCSLVDFLVYVP
jgi:hypothetical protein